MSEIRDAPNFRKHRTEVQLEVYKVVNVITKCNRIMKGRWKKSTNFLLPTQLKTQNAASEIPDQYLRAYFYNSALFRHYSQHFHFENNFTVLFFSCFITEEIETMKLSNSFKVAQLMTHTGGI